MRLLGLGTSETASERFKKEWGIEEPEGELKTAFTVAVAEWDRRRKDSEDNRTFFVIAQISAPLAAATATVLAASDVSKWAVIPAAIATVASSLLASFGLRENWARLRLMTRELRFEIVKFAEGYGSYRVLDDPARIDMLMTKIEKLSIQTVFDPTKPKNGDESSEQGGA